MIGFGAGNQMNNAGNNTFLGAFTATQATTGGNNIFVGFQAGKSATTNSNDIYIGNQGSTENNTIRIGTDGTGTGQQNRTFVAGINSQSIATGNPVWIDANGMLGIGSGSGGGGVTSFNSRTGAVVPQQGDYSFSLLSGTLGSSQLSGTYSNPVTFPNAANSFSGDGSGLLNVPVTAGSNFYIQNNNTGQIGANFTIDGNGFAGGTLTGMTSVDTEGTYTMFGNTVLAVNANQLLVGFGAGQSLVDGQFNTFLGTLAGQSTSSGGGNTFVGYYAGVNNNTSGGNTYIGANSAPRATGGGNTAIGTNIIAQLQTGGFNLVLGNGAGGNLVGGSQNIYLAAAGPSDESNIIRIGNSNQVATFISGINNQSISNGHPVWIDANGMLGTSSSSAVTSFNGRSGAVVPANGDYSFSQISGTAAVSQIPSLAGLYVQNGTSQQTGANFNIDGNGTIGSTLMAGNVDTEGNYLMGGTPIVKQGTDTLAGNLFLGFFAGQNDNNSDSNTYVGFAAGAQDTTGGGNTFIGIGAGENNITSGGNTYIGAAAAIDAKGGGNTTVGANIVAQLQTGGFNLVLGNGAGGNLIDGSQNIYLAAAGPSDESNTIRIGNSNQLATFISGINNQSISTGHPVWIDANGMLGIGSSSSGGVASFNGRTGAVVPASGDYSFSLLSGILKSSQLSGTYSSAITLSNASNIFTGNGVGLTNVNAASLGGLASSGFIQNTTSQQSSSNFNISGNGTAGGTITGTTAVNTGGAYQIGGTTVLSTPSSNTFVGQSAGTAETSIENTFVGAQTGPAATSQRNTLVGYAAGQAMTTGTGTFFGYKAGTAITTGTANTFVGFNAGVTVTTGSNNLMLGWNAGASVAATGSNNIYLIHPGTSGDNNTLRIGSTGSGSFQQNRAFIAGISGTTVSGGTTVVVNSSGQLGVASSSRRFKENILDMGSASSKLFQLRPVTFFYKPQFDDGSHILQYGLIAEEVAKVYPDLVVYGEDGQPQTVRYDLLTPMLLNELQKQNKVITAQQDVIRAQQERMSGQDQKISDLQRQNVEFQRQNADIQQRLSRVEALLSQQLQASSQK